MGALTLAAALGIVGFGADNDGSAHAYLHNLATGIRAIWSATSSVDPYASGYAYGEIGASIGSLALGGRAVVPEFGLLAERGLFSGSGFGLRGLRGQVGSVGAIATGEEKIGLTTRLNSTQIKEYLANAHNIPREQLIKDLESVNLEFKGSAEDGRFMSFVDKQGNVRVKLHPADRVTQYEHMHLYSKSGQDLSAELLKVHYRSPEAHIQVAPDEVNYNQEYYNMMMKRRQ